MSPLVIEHTSLLGVAVSLAGPTVSPLLPTSLLPRPVFRVMGPGGFS